MHVLDTLHLHVNYVVKEMGFILCIEAGGKIGIQGGGIGKWMFFATKVEER